MRKAIALVIALLPLLLTSCYFDTGLRGGGWGHGHGERHDRRF
jgi:hypothetical protein